MLVGFEGDAAQEMLTTYGSRGWKVLVASVDDVTAHERFVEAHPLAVVFCLSGECSDRVRTLARHFFETPGGGTPPLMVFSGGDADEVELTRSHVPLGVFVTPDEVGWVLKHLSVKM